MTSVIVAATVVTAGTVLAVNSTRDAAATMVVVVPAYSTDAAGTTPTPTPTPDAQFYAEAVSLDNAQSRIDFTFDISNASWSNTELHVNLQGARLVSAPEGFTCDAAGASITCVSPADNISGGSLIVAVSAERPSYTLELTTESLGTLVRATATSAVPVHEEQP